MTIKSGQKVLINTIHNENMDGDSSEDSKMIRDYGGKMMTIDTNIGGDWFSMVEDDGFWDWNPEMFSTTSQVVSSPIKKETLPEI